MTKRIESAGEIERRQFLQSSFVAIAGAALPSFGEEPKAESPMKTPIIDTHVHVWGNDLKRYPFVHPYDKDFKKPAEDATVETLIKDMDENGCTHAVLVQVIYHGWDNSYVADCVKRFPRRFKAHGLIDPTDPRVADKLEYWMKGYGLSGMRFSPIYYENGKHGGDGWLNAKETHKLWRKAEELGAVFNFFIAARQLPRLELMVRAHPKVPVVIDHLARVDLTAKDPESEFRLLLAMARYPNVWVKVSELNSALMSTDYPFRKAFPYVKRVYEAFGPHRLLFGTGFPGKARAAYDRPTLAEELDLFRKEMTFFTKDDQQRILGQNAAELWGFEPFK